jgi:hypothetical protein
MWCSCLVLTLLGSAWAQSGTFLVPPQDNTAQALLGTFPEGSKINFQWNTTFPSSDLVMFGYDAVIDAVKSYGQAYPNNPASVAMPASTNTFSWTVALDGLNGNPDWLVQTPYLYVVFFLYQHGATSTYSRTPFYNFTRKAVTTSSTSTTSTSSAVSTSSTLTSNPTSSSTGTAQNNGGKSSGLSTGAKAGIGIGAAIGGIALIIGLAFLLAKAGLVGGRRSAGDGGVATESAGAASTAPGYYAQQTAMSETGKGTPGKHYSSPQGAFGQHGQPEGYADGHSAPYELQGDGYQHYPGGNTNGSFQQPYQEQHQIHESDSRPIYQSDAGVPRAPN